MISVYSICSAVIFFNLALLLVFFMRRDTAFLLKYSTGALILLTLLGAGRLLLPLDLAHALVIPSEKILPAIRRFLLSSPDDGMNFGEALLLFWFFGSFIVLLCHLGVFLWEWLRRRRFVRVESPRVRRAAAELGIPSGRVTVSPDVATPMSVGFSRPHIYLPLMNFTDAELHWVLWHEQCHVTLRDSWIKLFYLLLTALFWWNPVVHLFQRELDSLLELRCDARAATPLDTERRSEYLGAILAVARALTARGVQPSTASCFAKRRDDLRQRFSLVLDAGRSATARAAKALSGLVIVAFCLSYFVIWQPSTPPPVEEYPGIISFTTENAYILETSKGEHILYVDDERMWPLSDAEVAVAPFSELDVIKG